MNRLSLLSSSLPVNQKQNLKQAAYIQYLKSFAQNGLVALQKLQGQFNRHFDRSNIKEDLKVFQKIKTLLASYEVFVIGKFRYYQEIHDSCQFIEVPQFGTCILKVFIQLIGILKWALQYLVTQKKTQPRKSQLINTPFNPNLGSTISRFSPSVSRRQSTMRNTYTPNLQTLSKQNRCSQCAIKTQQNAQDMYKIREQTTLQLKDINEEIARIAKQYKDQEKETKKQDEERMKLDKFIRKRQEEEKSYLNIGLGEQSKNQEILSQILYALNRKGEAIKRFADLRMSSLGESNKIQQSTEEDYENFKHQLEIDITQKVIEAKQKLSTIFKEHFMQHNKLKKSQLVDAQVQIQESQAAKLNKFFNDKQLKKLKSEMKRLQKELEEEKDLNEELKKILADKSIEYEGEVMKYRNQIISLEVKTKNNLKTASKLRKQQTDNNFPNPTITNTNLNFQEEKSLVSIDMNGPKSHQTYQELQQEDKFQQLIFQKTKSFLNTKKRLSKTKNIIKFQQILQKQPSCTLESPIFSITIMPTLKESDKLLNSTVTQKSIIRKGQEMKRMEKTNESFSQTTNDLLEKYLSIMIQNQEMDKTQGLSKTFSSSKASKCTSNLKSNANVISYSKKRSSHMGSLSTYYEIQTNPISQSCSKNLSKTSMFIKRNVQNQPFNKQIKNQFIPIFQNPSPNTLNNYKKNYFQKDKSNKILRNSNLQQNEEISIKSNQNTILSTIKIKKISPKLSSRWPAEISDDSDFQTTVNKQVFYPKGNFKSKDSGQLKEQLRSTLQENYQFLESEDDLKNEKKVKIKHLKNNLSMNVLPVFTKAKRKTKVPSNVQKIAEDFLFQNENQK